MARIDQYSTRQPSRTDILLGTDEPTGRTSNFSLADLEDFLLMNKGDRKVPIEQRIDLTSLEPENPASGGRYLNTVTGTSSITSTAVVADYIYELRAGEWVELIPVEGFTLWDKNAKENITYAGAGYGWVANTVSGAQLVNGLNGVNNSLDQNFTFDENGNITGFSEAFTSTVNTTVAGEGFATASSVSEVGVNLSTLTGNFNSKVIDDTAAFAGIPHTFKQDDAPTDSDPKFIRNSVWYDTNDGNKAYVLEPQSETPNAPLVWVEATDERLGELITEVGAQKSILIDTNGHVAGMTMGNFGPDKSYISFLADRFRIYTYDENTAGGSVSNPFVVENGIVKISQLATRDITVGDVPSEAQSTVIFATTSNGANASTSKFDADSGGNITLTRTHVFLANTRWVDGDSLDNSWVFERIAGVNGTSVNIEGSVNDVASLPTTGNSPGDGYLISGEMYVWDGSQWNNAGNIQGPEGNDGITPSFGLDYQNGADGSFHSYIYKVTDTQPTRPPSTGTAFYQGSFDGISEVIPDGWTDSPSVSLEDVEWVSKAIYENTKTYHPTTGAETTTWTKRTTSGHNWSEPVKIYQKGDVGDTGTPGADAYTVVLANESHTVQVSAVGVHNYTDSGTSIVAYKGSEELQGRVSGTPGPGQFTVTPNTSRIGIDGSPSVPSGSKQVTIPDMRNMTSDTANVTYSINLEDNITIIKKQSFTKSQDGQPGQNGSPGDSITGTPGSPGKKTATGLIFYQVSSANAPSLPIAGNASFDFTDGSVSGLTSNWNTATPSLGPGTSTSTFWSSRYYAVETNANSDIGTLTFDSPVSMYSFDQVVTFSALGAPGTTTIDGGNIKTGTIKSENHSGNSTGSDMSNAGTSFNLTTGAISSENFRIDASGNSEFSGTMKIGANTLTEENTLNENVDTPVLLHITTTAPGTAIPHGLSTTESTGLIYTFQSKVAGPAQLKLVVYDAEATGTYPNYKGIQASVNGNPLKTRLRRHDVGGANNTNNTYFDTVQVVEGENSLNLWGESTPTSDDGGRLVEAEIVYIQTDDKKSGTVGGWTVDSNAIYSGNKDTNGFKSDGGITLSSAGSIHAKDFYIDTGGNANFRGTMTIGGTDLDAQNTFNSNTSKSDVGLGNVDNTSDSTLLSNAGINSNNQDKTAGTVGGWKIDGDAIYTGTKDTNGYSSNGFTLSSDGTLHSKEFYIDEYGNAYFQGRISLTEPATIYKGKQTVLMQPSNSRIIVKHEASEYYTNDEGRIDLDSEGIEVWNKGRRVFGTGAHDNASRAALDIDCRGYEKTFGIWNSTTGEYSTHAPGTRWVTGIYARASNTYPEDDKKYLFEPLGAVVEDLRADGFVQRLYNAPAGAENSATLQLPDNYVLYIISDSRRKVYLPQNPKTGQTVKIIRTGGSKTKLVYANYTSTLADATNKIFYLGSDGSDWDTYVEVGYCEEFIWTGVYWLRNKMD